MHRDDWNGNNTFQVVHTTTHTHVRSSYYIGLTTKTVWSPGNSRGVAKVRAILVVGGAEEAHFAHTHTLPPTQ